MNNIFTIQYNQTLLDVALQTQGSVFAVVDIALDNGISITNEINVGTNLEIVNTGALNIDVLEYYNKFSIKPSTKNDNTIAGIVPNLVFKSKLYDDNFKVKVISNQSMLDIAIQQTGTLKSVLDFAKDNDASITDFLTVGSVLKSNSTITNKETLVYYNKYAIKPATGITINPNVEIIPQTLFESGLFENGLFE